MNSILLIGNSGLKNGQMDGQTIKVRLYLKKIQDEGFSVCFIDLENFLMHPFSVLRRIKSGIKECSRIVLITAERGSKILIPFINRINKKYGKPFVFPLVGTSVLHYSIDPLSSEKKSDFLLNKNFSNFRPDKKLVKELKKITYILPETDSLSDVFKSFYSIDNVETLTNFRDFSEIGISRKEFKTSNVLKVVFLSRIMEEKGIFDLLESLSDINKKEILAELHIYGDLSLNDVQKEKFFEMIDCNWVSYRNSIKFDKVINTLAEYDLFVFPTRFVHEGTPGVIVESLLAGVPILTSNFPQVCQLLKPGTDSISYEMFNCEELKQKLLYLINNKNVLETLTKGAVESGKRFSYEYNRSRFLELVCGAEKLRK